MNDQHRRAMRAKAHATALYSGQPSRLTSREQESKSASEREYGKRAPRPRFVERPEELFD